ncbi:peroxisome biogenesis protein 1-like [Pyrus ussuriensis x Pyrus communis]|uniref:Peroxisome biogenesis protein 1-like n=1 Tax=Pyrus ussuriensis x Pyrus communis TaxID=2448454 RepID=A0A5N5FEZ2_9ROSA|nr:peroxisome biogenesis protein 1-like [Pyrus ussuriensis x Pyrus communis]
MGCKQEAGQLQRNLTVEISEKDNREAIVRLLISDSVVKGHVMIQLYGTYNQFLDSKRCVATQSRDAKGKRATLA